MYQKSSFDVKTFIELEGVTSVDEHLKTLLAVVESELSLLTCLFRLILFKIHFLIPHESAESIVNMIQHDT